MIEAASRVFPLEREEAAPVFDTGPVNILVVDDIPDKIIAYQAILEDLGQNIVTALSGEKALKLVLQQEFAVILLDVNMPGMDGFEIASFIRQRKKSSHTPIIFLTAFTDEMRMQQGYASGAVDYLPTPVVPEILRAKVQVFIELAQMRRQAARQAEESAMRKSAEEAARRSEFLMNASETFTRSQNQQEIIHALVHMPIPYLADVSALWLQNGKLPQRYWGHVNESGVRVCELLPDDSSFPLLETSIRQVVESGEPQLLTQISASALRPGEPHSAATGGDAVSALILPFAIRNEIRGALILARNHTGNSYPIANISLVKELLSKASVALDNILLLERIREADRRKDEFLAMLAHELRNPLAPIQNALYVMKVSSSTQLRREAEETIESQLRHMVHLVDDLMDVSRITQGKIELRKEPVLLREALLHAIETAQPLIRQRGHRLDAQLPEAGVYLYADFSRISQIFSNLLTNAAKYTNDNGHISLSTQVEGGGVTISVSDNGIGIPHSMIQRIFDIFLQVDSSLERTQGGLGIGLSLAKNLVEMHGGNISAFSAGPGCGSEFRVSLPLAEMSQVAHKDAEPDMHPGHMSLKVLVVDDSEASAKTLGWMLESFGCNVSLAHNGKDAIDYAKAVQPDVVLLDIGLPGMNGYEVCRTLKDDPLTSNAIYIAQTGWGQAEHRQKSQSVGFDYHLVKPVDIAALQNIMGNLRDKAGKALLQF